VLALGQFCDNAEMILRSYHPEDSDALAAIYRDAVSGLGIASYTAEQVAVWASFPDDDASFRDLLARGFALVVEVDGSPAAFCHLHPADHISLLYTATRHARRGFATAAYLGVEAYAREQGQQILTTDASKISRPFFEHHGFVVRRTEQTIRQGVAFERYQMEKRLE
jgi:putative acetyltransferase